jgi:hypothetical protein
MIGIPEANPMRRRTLPLPLERDASVPPPVKDDGAPTETTAASGKTDGTTETSAFARVVIHDLPTLLLPVAIPAAEDDDDITTAEEDDDSAEVRRDAVALVVVVVVVAVMASGDGGMFVCGGGSATVVVVDRGVMPTARRRSPRTRRLDKMSNSYLLNYVMTYYA